MQQFYRLGDNVCGRFPPLLPISIGMPVVVTQNMNPNIGVENGSTGKIVGYKFSSGV